MYALTLSQYHKSRDWGPWLPCCFTIVFGLELYGILIRLIDSGSIWIVLLNSRDDILDERERMTLKLLMILWRIVDSLLQPSRSFPPKQTFILNYFYQVSLMIYFNHFSHSCFWVVLFTSFTLFLVKGREF